MILKYSNVEIRHDENIILSGVDLEINPGDFVFIIGKVGSGKSTLLSTIYGELKPTAGEANVLGHDLLKMKRKHISPLRKQLGIVFQSFELLTDRNVRRNLEFVLRSTGWKKKADIKTRIKEVLSQVELLDKEEAFPYELSGGEQQRVAIARALLNSPKLIIADEPTGNLDIESSESIMQLLDEIRQEGTAIIMSTHNLQLIDKIPGARVYNCADGKMEQVQPAQTAQPAQTTVETTTEQTPNEIKDTDQ